MLTNSSKTRQRCAPHLVGFKRPRANSNVPSPDFWAVRLQRVFPRDSKIRHRNDEILFEKNCQMVAEKVLGINRTHSKIPLHFLSSGSQSKTSLSISRKHCLLQKRKISGWGPKIRPPLNLRRSTSNFYSGVKRGRVGITNPSSKFSYRSLPS